MTDKQLFTLISNVLGVDVDEIQPDAEFILDLNASPIELMEIKQQVENELEIQLPIEDETDFPLTVDELSQLIQDLCL